MDRHTSSMKEKELPTDAELVKRLEETERCYERFADAVADLIIAERAGALFIPIEMRASVIEEVPV